MKFLVSLILSLGLLAASRAAADVEAVQQPVPMERSLSAPASELVRLTDSNIDESVVRAYINNSTAQFNLSAADIVYLRDLGFSSEIITAMIDHDKVLREKEPVAPETVTATPSPAPPDGDQIYNAPAPVPSNLPPEVERFYADLAPYGNWISSAEFGWGWQPTVVGMNRDWRPYSDGGRWVWTDRGWYWASDYSWGEITFHYGRWLMTQNWGWLWFPDTVWAPAWVTWRVYDSYCGWAPLPPATFFDTEYRLCYRERVVWSDCDFDLRPACFTFVHFRHCFTPNPRSHCVPGAQVNYFFNNTVVINNFHRHNDVIVNRGIDVHRVAEATGKEIQAVPVVAPGFGPAKATGPRVTRNGKTIAVVQKPLPPAPKVVASDAPLARLPKTIASPPVVAKPNPYSPSFKPGVQENKKPGSVAPVKNIPVSPAVSPDVSSTIPSHKPRPAVTEHTPAPMRGSEIGNKPALQEIKAPPIKQPAPVGIKAQNLPPVSLSQPPIAKPVAEPAKVAAINPHFSQPIDGSVAPAKNISQPITPAPAITPPNASPGAHRFPVAMPPARVEKIAQFNAPVVQPSIRVAPPAARAVLPGAHKDFSGVATPVPSSANDKKDHHGKKR